MKTESQEPEPPKPEQEPTRGDVCRAIAQQIQKQAAEHAANCRKDETEN